MSQASFPFYCFVSNAAARVIGGEFERVGVLALKAILLRSRSLEIAHQQIRYRGHDLAFSSRINAAGNLILDIDLGDPKLADRLILESEIRRRVRDSQAARPRRR